MDPNTQLMAKIREKWGPIIMTVCRSSSVPENFLAALIANESGGDVNAKRFEPHVLSTLFEVCVGRNPTFGSIGRDAILNYASHQLPGEIVEVVSEPESESSAFTAALHRLDGLATSWGLTQLMGYHILDPSMRNGTLITIEDLILPSKALPATLRLLSQFAQHFGLNLAADFGELFDCWNTGQPKGKTADPEYVDHGISRMSIYGHTPPTSVSA